MTLELPPVAALTAGQQYRTKAELAHQWVRSAILSGALAPGSVINQVELAAAMDMSTTPLREALNRLHADGLVVTDANRDTRVIQLNAEEALHIYEVRRELDPLSARLAARRRTEGEVTMLRRALERLGAEMARTPEESIEAHGEFHRVLYQASHNEILVAALDVVWARSDRYRRFGDKVIPKRAVARRHLEHSELVELIASQDADKAAAAMATHVETSLVSQATSVLADRAATAVSEPADAA